MEIEEKALQDQHLTDIYGLNSQVVTLLNQLDADHGK